MTLAKRMRAVRKHFGLDQRAMAGLVAIPYRTYQAYEQGRQPPKTPVLQRLGARGINLDWLVVGRGDMTVDGAPGRDGLDCERLTAALLAVEDIGRDANPPPSVERRVRMALALYDLSVNSVDPARVFDPDMVRRLFDLAN